MVFFSKNKQTAMVKLKQLQEKDNFYKRYKGVRLAKQQIKHISNWKTWSFV